MAHPLDIKCEYFSGSCVVSKKPCWIYSIIATEVTTAVKAVTLRNGRLVTSPIKLKGQSSAYDAFIAIFQVPIYFSNGLYLQFEVGLDSVTLQYKPEY
ncbi:unnamed protein product [marine sediment metagenome]|uniref:Uncharacterized protein n=1 Tax=marine sediment metagenome TaxID=412755 RepID=X1NXV7_9ZZZZ